MMNKLILSAFADEYADGLKEQCEALNKFGIEYIELRGVNGKNVSVLTENEVKEAKKTLDDYGIKVSSIGSPLGKIDINGDLNGHLETAKRVYETAKILGTKNVRMFSFYARLFIIPYSVFFGYRNFPLLFFAQIKRFLRA